MGTVAGWSADWVKAAEVTPFVGAGLVFPEPAWLKTTDGDAEWAASVSPVGDKSCEDSTVRTSQKWKG